MLSVPQRKTIMTFNYEKVEKQSEACRLGYN